MIFIRLPLYLHDLLINTLRKHLVSVNDIIAQLDFDIDNVSLIWFHVFDF